MAGILLEFVDYPRRFVIRCRYAETSLASRASLSQRCAHARPEIATAHRSSVIDAPRQRISSLPQLLMSVRVPTRFKGRRVIARGLLPKYH
jgi:hypothetical protein